MKPPVITNRVLLLFLMYLMDTADAANDLHVLDRLFSKKPIGTVLDVLCDKMPFLNA